jgi:hypothetical protein
MALDTVQDYVAASRVLLQDLVDSPYRYPTSDLLLALNMAVLESRKLRPDMWAGISTLPSYAVSDATKVKIDPQYRVAFVYYVVGSAQLRDNEEDTDTRASAFIAQFRTMLLGIT